jgi:rod shape-determining protein MreD
MSNTIVVVVSISIILFLQVGVLPHLSILEAYPNLILVSILALSILQGWKKTLPWIIVGGLSLDFYSLNNVLGVSVIGLLIVSYLSYILSQNTFKKTTFFSLTSVFLIAVFVYNAFLMLFWKVFDINIDFKFFGFVFGIVYNLIFALPIFYWLKKYANRPEKIQG